MKPSEGLPNVSCGSNIVHRAVRLRMVLGLRTLARSRRNDTDSFVQYLRDPNKRLSVGPSLRLVAVCSSKHCQENGRSFKNWKVVIIGHCKIDKKSPNLSVIHLVGSRIPVPDLGSKDGATIVRGTLERRQTKIPNSQQRVSHLCHKFFSVVFFERDSELTLFGFGTAQSQSAEPQLEVHRASCPADC